MSLHRQGLIRALLAAWVAVLGLVVHAAPDAVRGEQLYVRCMACHALAMDRVGPRHCGVLGRRAGSVAGFDYSSAMKRSGIVWNEKTLDRFLLKPLAMVPGSSMTYDGVPDARDRRDLIAYLRSASSSAACRQKP
jgi:cytochrome c